MARELSQEEVLDFLCQGGGKVPNASLLAHFKLFLRDPQAPTEQLLKRRERFKRYVNSVAVVKPEGGVKYVVLRSRYRDLLGEDLSQPSAPVKNEQVVPALPHGAQVRDGLHSNGLGHQGAHADHQDLQAVVLISDVAHGAVERNTWDATSYKDPYTHDHEVKCQETSQWSFQAPNPDSTSSCFTSSPASNTSSPQNNASSLHRRPSMEYSKSSPIFISASPPSDKHHQPINNYLPSSKSCSPASRNPSSLPRSPSREYSKQSPPAIRASPPLGKSYHQQPINTYLTTSLPASKDSSPSNKSNSSSNHPYHNQSSLSSPAGSLDIPEIPSQLSVGHFKVPSVGQKKTESSNPAIANYTIMDQEVQQHGYYACAELPLSHFHLNGIFSPKEHKDYSDPVQDKEQMPSFYKELPPLPPSSRYIDSPHPSPSLLFPHESSITPPDVQLEDYHAGSRSPSPPLPLYDIHEMWMSKMPVFKSIRCQLSLQDMEDFVDQESCGSEGSDSGEGADCDTEHNIDEDPSSDSNNDKYVHCIEEKCENTRRCPPSRKFLSITEQYDKLKSSAPLEMMDTVAICGVESAGSSLATIEYSKSPYATKSFLTDQAPVLFALARNPPRHKMSSRMPEVMSSSDDELIERDYKKRRRPSRSKRPSNIGLVPPQPDVDLLLTVKPVSSNHFIMYDIDDQKSLHVQYEPKVNTDFRKTFNSKSSTVVPLDSTEHDWFVKSATGSWLQVYGLFIEDPSLALRKDFISGFTALHWFAKHGAADMFPKLVSGAKKAGIQLDLNVKSNGGYTPLHIAAIHGHQKVASLLVEKLNVNVNLRDNSGKRAWQYLSCNTSGEVWHLLGAPKGKTIFASRALNIANTVNTQNKSSQINRKTSLAAFLKPQHQKWKANNHPALREREIYSD
ncbi:ankyrin repeat domain-containing protein SOWAHB [Bufo gargarizans]|uniref:ankyrin repeat domain-containing protein SOWAHB n=1 Tax=Bufo gargarizans TaxID=30331 RepID=UPI001CF3FC50|nr:ankyrin repeat domain-containing protein SOWAHB [Bufo gargarizans]